MVHQYMRQQQRQWDEGRWLEPYEWTSQDGVWGRGYGRYFARIYKEPNGAYSWYIYDPGQRAYAYTYSFAAEIVWSGGASNITSAKEQADMAVIRLRGY